jgi:GMP synthase-like glutamine amidotransferase
MSETPLPGPILVIENDRSDPIGRLGDWLVAAGAELEVVSAPAGAPIPTNLGRFSGLVVMGGAPNAYEDDRAPWLPAVRGLLADAVRVELPTLAICLGGQLLAAATGGRVERAQTPEYGAQLIAKRQAAATDPLFRDLPLTPDVLQWHVDAVTQLPPGAVLLASSPGCEVQAFRVGRLAWGTQFHIETSPDTVAAWAAEDAEALSGYDLDTIVARAVAAHPDIAETWQPFATAFVEVLRDPQVAAGPRRLPLAAAGQPLGNQTMAEPITDPAAIRAALAAEMQAARGTHGH